MLNKRWILQAKVHGRWYGLTYRTTLYNAIRHWLAQRKVNTIWDNFRMSRAKA